MYLNNSRKRIYIQGPAKLEVVINFSYNCRLAVTSVLHVDLQLAETCWSSTQLCHHKGPPAAATHSSARKKTSNWRTFSRIYISPPPSARWSCSEMFTSLLPVIVGEVALLPMFCPGLFMETSIVLPKPATNRGSVWNYPLPNTYSCLFLRSSRHRALYIHTYI